MPAPSPDRARDHRRMPWRLAAVVALAVVVHGRSVGFGFTYLDDDVLIADNQAMARAPDPVRAFARPYLPSSDRDHSYYRPLVNASFELDALLWGIDPHGYHATNVALHALAAALLFVLLGRLGYSHDVAWFGALVFVVHPALTETVDWIPGRNDSLLTVFGLLAWILLPQRQEDRWEGTRPPGDGTTNHGGSKAAGDESRDRMPVIVGGRIAHICALLGALLTKETAVVLPAVYATHLLWLERRPRRSVMRPWLLGGWALAVALAVGARILVTGAHGASRTTPVGLAAVSTGRMLRNLFPIVVGGLGKLVLPVHLSVLAIPEDTWLWPGVLAAALIVIAARFTPAVRAERVRFGLMAFVAFLVPGLPASNLLFLENRLTLPAIGIVIVACEIASRTTWPARLKVTAAAVVVASCAVASFVYGDNFRDRVAFAEAAVRGSPHSSLAHRNLGVTYQLAGNADLAREQYDQALTQDAAEPVVHNNLAVLLMARGQLPDAERQLREELRINPSYARAHHNLAMVLHALGRDEEAVAEWETSLTLDPADEAAERALVAYRGHRLR